MAAQSFANPGLLDQRGACLAEEICLEANRSASFRSVRAGKELSVTSGIIWLTQSDDLNDYVVTAGERFTITRPGLVVIQAMQHQPARLVWEN